MKQTMAIIFVIVMISSPVWAAKIMDPSAYTVQQLSVNGYAVNCIAFTNERTWIGTDLGLLSSSVSQPNITQHFNSANAGLPSDRVTALAAQGELLWIGTDNGLAMLTIGKNRAVIPAASPFGGCEIEALAVDAEGVLWIGATRLDEETMTVLGTGLTSFDGKTWQSFTVTNSGLAEDMIGSIAIGKDKRKWLGTTYHPFMKEAGAGLVSYDGKQFADYIPAEEFSSVECLAIDASDKLWMGLAKLRPDGMYGGGLAAFDGQDWSSFTTINSDIPGDYIPAIAIARDGRLWMGSMDNSEEVPDALGLLSFDGNDDWQLIEQQFLPGRYSWITALGFDPEGKLWVGTDSGLAVISFPAAQATNKVEFHLYEDPPQVIGSIKPQYPDAAKRAKVQGTVVLEVEVFKDGSVGQINVKRSVTGLDQAAIDALKKVKFKPGKLSGKAVNTTVIIPIEFRLN